MKIYHRRPYDYDNNSNNSNSNSNKNRKLQTSNPTFHMGAIQKFHLQCQLGVCNSTAIATLPVAGASTVAAVNATATASATAAVAVAVAVAVTGPSLS